MKNTMGAGRQSGFTMIELLVASSIGLVVATACVQLYLQAMNTASTITQRSLLQQDARSASDLMMRDISLAGSGFTASVPLVSGTSLPPKLGIGTAYPLTAGVYSIYPIIPGDATGISVMGGTKTDTITVTSTDNVFNLGCYTASVTSSTTVVFSACADSTVPAVTDSVAGLQTGDIVWFSGSANGVSGSTVTLIGEVTGSSGSSSPYTVNFAAGDTLNLNQPSATSGSFASCFAKGETGCTGTGTRLWVTTYYIALDAGGTPTLMRQVNGQTANPVAPNVFNLQFDYSLFDPSALTVTRSSNPTTFMNIKQVNLLHLTMRSSTPGTKGFSYQGLDIQTSVSIRNLGATPIVPSS